MTSAETTPPPAEPVNPVALALHVFDDPAGTFKRLAARPVAWLPILLILVVTAVAQFLVPVELQRQQTEKVLARVEQQTGKPLDPAVRAKQLAKIGAPTQRVIGVVTGTVIGIVWLAIVGGVCKLIFGAGAADPITFRQEFAIAAHANLVLLLGAIVTVILVRTSGRLDTSVSLGFLVPSGFTHAYLGRLSVWGAWDVALLALGNKVLTKAKSLTGPLLILGGLWLALNIPLAFLAKMGMGQ